MGGGAVAGAGDVSPSGHSAASASPVRHGAGAVWTEAGRRTPPGVPLCRGGGSVCGGASGRDSRRPHQRPDVAGDPPGEPRARPARTHAAAPPGAATGGGEGVRGAGSGRELHPALHAVSAGRGASATLPDAQGALLAVPFPGPGAHGWRVESAVLPPGATPTRQDPGAGRLYGPGAYRVLSG